MGKYDELKRIQDIVEDVLTEQPVSRNSDDMLYVMVCKKINAAVLDMPFRTAMVNRKAYNIPAFETVRRTRQKLQADHPELRGYAKVTKHHRMYEEDFRDYATGVVNGRR